MFNTFSVLFPRRFLLIIIVPSRKLVIRRDVTANDRLITASRYSNCRIIVGINEHLFFQIIPRKQEFCKRKFLRDDVIYAFANTQDAF